MLKSTLNHIYSESAQHHTIEQPGVKRGSVSIIVKVKHYGNFENLDEYIQNLSEDAVGEVLFIKRAENPRDRWSGHIAIPGGRQDAGETDVQTAIRETYEEVGIDLNRNGFFVGGLDQRLLRISWGSRIAMVLCPYVFVLNNPDVEIIPQWSEVCSCFWIPISQLIDPDRHTYHVVPVGDRLGLHWMGPLRHIITYQVGNMRFSAINLYPLRQLTQSLRTTPFPLWGVTLGVMSDFLEIYNPGHFNDYLSLPTLDGPDMRFWIWLLSRRYTQEKKLSILATIQSSGMKSGEMDLFNKLIHGHFYYFPRAIFISISLRFVAGVLAVRWLVRKLR